MRERAFHRKAVTEAGFTLLEIMVVVAIISALAMPAIPRMLAAQRMAYERDAIQPGKATLAQPMQFRDKFGRFPSSLSEMVANGFMADKFKVVSPNPKALQ